MSGTRDMDAYDMSADIKEIIYTKEQIDVCIAEMGEQLSRDYAGKDPVVICVLKGAAFFMADLVRAMTIPLQIDFMAVSSYGNAAVSSGKVRILKDLNTDIAGRHVIIAEDILDSGVTLSHLIDELKSREPASLEIAALLRKEGAQKVQIDCRYEGMAVPNDFVVGFGLDYAERYRNLPFVAALKPEVYQ